MTALVLTGTRHREEVDERALRKILDVWLGHFDKLYVGDADGFDEIVRKWAAENGVDYEVFYADWKKLRSGAGPERNGRMLRKAIEEHGRGGTKVLAWPGRVPKGTRDCAIQALELGCWLRVIGPNGAALFRRSER